MLPILALVLAATPVQMTVPPMPSGDQVAQMFAMFDVNHDGRVTRAEMESTVRAMAAPHVQHGEIRQAQVDMLVQRALAIFPRADLNHDGVLDRNEVLRGAGR